MTREDDHPIAEVFRRVCREQLGRVPVTECWVDDDTERDVMEVLLVMVTGVGRIKLPVMRLEGQAEMTTERWYSELRCEMRRWFKEVRR